MKSIQTKAVGRLLRANISAAQLAGYGLANLVGMTIILVAIQFYCDISSIYGGKDSQLEADYVVISKPVSGLAGLTGGTESGLDFSAAEIEEIKAQPWAEEVGAFTAARFNVAAALDMGGRGFSTQLFLESLPDEFIDARPAAWGYTPGESKEIPIIISKDYLTLYNFGFAATRGLPQISEELVGMVPLRLSVSGGGRQQWFDARIVGFSKRLNTIAVPEEFMTWANGEFGDTPAKGVDNPSRLIIRLDRPGSAEAERFIAEKGYETAGDNGATGRVALFLTILTGIIIAIGAVISALAFAILVLSIYLLLQKNRTRLTDLMGLGYRPSDLSARYRRLIATINVATAAGAFIIAACATALWRGKLAELGVEGGTVVPALATGVVLTAALTAFASAIISRNVKRAFRA